MAANDLVGRRALSSGIGIVQPNAGLDALAATIAGRMRPHASTSVMAVVPFDWGVLLKVQLRGFNGTVAQPLLFLGRQMQ